jgi:hypothetical protein
MEDKVRQPQISATSFGSITVDGEAFDHDIVIQLDGQVRKRHKKLSKAVFGTSHVISLAEAEDIFEKGAKGLIIGTGQSGMVRLSDEAADYFRCMDCKYDMLPTPQAIHVWNEADGEIIAMFHITC